MTMARSILSLLVGGLFFASSLGAQTPTGTIAGTVIDGTTRAPIAGASVVVDGTAHGTHSSPDGNFLLRGVPAGTHRISVTLIGYSRHEQEVTVPAGGTVTAQIQLQPEAIALGNIVVTGYGSQRREAITGSISSVDVEEANVGVISNATEMIQGRVAGVQVSIVNGEPGAGSLIRIRGSNSISASNEPLFVIDGVPVENRATEARGMGINSDPPLARNPLNLINTSDIESISILKDAAATAIYGSRAANGVVLIQTKRGVAGQAGMEYDGYVAMAAPAKYIDVLTGSEYRDYVQGLVDSGDTRFQERLANLGSADTDWQRELTRSALTHNHNVAFHGGSETTRYRASLNYMTQEGVVMNNGLERIQGRINASHEALDQRLRLGLNLTASRINNDYLPYENTGGFEGGVFTNMVIYDPTRPVMVTDPGTGLQVFYEHGKCDAEGCNNFSRQEQRNPVALATEIDDLGSTTRMLGNVTAALDLFAGLTAQVNLGVDQSEGLRLGYLPRTSPVGYEFSGRARQVDTENGAVTLQTLLTLQRQFTDHQFDVVGGYEFAEYTAAEFGAEGQGFATDAFRYHNLGGGNVLVKPWSWREESRLVSFFSRVNYGWQDRYYLTGVLRYDGSSRFGAGNKWALFPAVSASWRISEESFFPAGRFSDLRLRVGYGQQGNQAVPPYASLITLAPGNNYSFGNDPVTGITPTRNPNPDLKWEETSQFNVAVDYGLLDNRLTGSAEYYVKNTSDLLLEVPVPQPALVPTRLENVGKTSSKGVELSLDARVLDRQDLGWSAGLVFAADRNEIVDLGGRNYLQSAQASGQGQSDTWTQRLIEGQALGTFYGPQFVGVCQGGEALVGGGTCTAGSQLFNKYEVQRAEDGSIISQDVIGLTTAPGGDDYVVIGNANPDYMFGLTNRVDMGRFDLSLFIRAEVGQEVFNNTALVYSTKNAVFQGRNFLRSALDDGTGLGEASIYSSRWIEDGSFLRVQNLTLGYTFGTAPLLPQVRNGRLYLSFDNLLLLTGYSGYDPEVHTAAPGLAVRGVDYLNYPRPRTMTAGIRFSF
ncbi:MAG TPA: TonB-dependent receptor [Longimicrobiales bacterium]|nr:TonB-dependent receptor [Longimicrobiales bacterium]